MSNIKAVVFDMDGVLIDSRLMISTAINDVLAARGLSTTPETIVATAGQPMEVMYQTFAPGHDAAQLVSEHLRHHEAHLHLLRAYDGAAEALASLHKEYKLGIFTGFNEMSRQRLALFDLDQYFDEIVDATMYKRHKPDPEGLLLCLEKLGVSPLEAVYIGDARNDIQAGRAAGVGRVIGITHGFGTRDELLAAGADATVDSMAAVVAEIRQAA